jgi:molybdopterin/thiamine biosynthesis adenylyltransferase
MLGVGGLGSVITIHLLRMGIGRIILVDYDTVDITNLNRQIIYSQ